MGDLSTATFEVVEIPLEQIHGARWNANVVPPEILAKVKRSLEEFGIVENSVVRPLPNPCPYCELMTELPHYEVLSGNHRGIIYEEAGRATMPCSILELSDGRARIFADMMNRTRGENDPDRYRILLEDALALPDVDIGYITDHLPETEESIKRIVADLPPAVDASGYGDAQLFGVSVECRDEAEQLGLIEDLQAQGYTVRAVML